jgi:hypothetical protein
LSHASSLFCSDFLEVDLVTYLPSQSQPPSSKDYRHEPLTSDLDWVTSIEQKFIGAQFWRLPSPI